MLSLKISGKNVDLPDDFSFTMNLKSPIFGDIGSYSYPFRIPVTPRNASIMGFGHRVESTTDRYLERQASFEWNGLSLFSGKSLLKTMNSKSYEGSIFDGSGDLNYQIKNNYLHQYDYGEMSWSLEHQAMTWINSCIDKVYPERPCAFPAILNDSYFETPQTELAMRFINYNDPYGDSRIWYLSPLGHRTPIIPMLYFRYVLEKLFAGMGYVLDDEFFSIYPDFNKLVLYNSVSCNNEVGGLFPYFVTHLYFNAHVPRVKLSDFFTGIENMFNVRFFVNQVTKTIRIVPLTLTLTSSDYADFSSNVISISSEIEDKVNGYKLKMELDSDDGAFETQNAIEDDFLQSLAGSVVAVSDLPPWPIAISLERRYVIQTNTYYRMINKVWVADSGSADKLRTQYLFKDPTVDISTILSTLMMGGATTFCNCLNKQINYASVTPRLFFIRLLQSPEELIGENFANAFGSLYYNGATGLFEKQFRKWLSWRVDTKLVKINRQMSFPELKAFDFEKKIMIGGIKYLVKSVQVTLKKDRIMPALLECYTCP